MNLLSIDWDYFFDASSAVRMECFQPVASEDYGDNFTMFAWAACYGEHGERLTGIGVKPVLADVLRLVPETAPLYIYRSHLHAYDVFSKFARKKDRITLLHIDEHPDTTQDGSKNLHCGNWLLRFMASHTNRDNRFVWLSNGAYTGDCPKNLEVCTSIDGTGLSDIRWDAVYIARSDVWSPPHLDSSFIKAFRPLFEDRKSKRFAETGVWQDRYTYGFEAVVKELQQPVIEDPLLREGYRRYQKIAGDIRRRELRTCFSIR